MMPVTQEIRELTMNRSSSAVIAEMARRQGMKAMRQNGMRKVLQGVTTLEEIVRVLTIDEEA